MAHRNDDDNGFISLDKSDYPEIYPEAEDKYYRGDDGELYPYSDSSPAADDRFDTSDRFDIADRFNTADRFDTADRFNNADRYYAPSDNVPSGEYYAPAAADAGVFGGYLMGGERVLWSGKGKSAGKGTPMFFSIMWTGFSVFWTFGASKAGGLFFLFGLPFIAIGIYLLVTGIKGGPYVHCAVTDRRVLILHGNKLETEYLDKITDARVYQVSRSTANVKIYYEMLDMPDSAISEKLLVGLETAEAQRVCEIILSMRNFNK